MSCKATAGGMTKMPTSQSATARDITKQLVTVRSLLVVRIAMMTRVLPTTVTTITMQSNTARLISCQPGGAPGNSTGDETFGLASGVVKGDGVEDIADGDFLPDCHICKNKYSLTKVGNYKNLFKE